MGLLSIVVAVAVFTPLGLGVRLPSLCDDATCSLPESQWFRAEDHRPAIDAFVKEFSMERNLRLLDAFGASMSMTKCWKNNHQEAETFDIKISRLDDVCSRGGFFRLLELGCRLAPNGLCMAGPPCSLHVSASQSVHERSEICLQGNCKNFKVRLSNRIWRNFAEFLRAILHRGILIAIEQPCSSWAFRQHHVTGIFHNLGAQVERPDLDALEPLPLMDISGTPPAPSPMPLVDQDATSSSPAVPALDVSEEASVVATPSHPEPEVPHPEPEVPPSEGVEKHVPVMVKKEPLSAKQGEQVAEKNKRKKKRRKKQHRVEDPGSGKDAPDGADKGPVAWKSHEGSPAFPPGDSEPNVDGQFSSELLAKSIRAYAHEVGRDGYWLDWLDAVLFAQNNGKTLAFINFNVATRDGSLTIDHASGYLKEVPGLDDVEAGQVVSRTPDTWLLVSCNSEWDRTQPANHWIPAVFKEVVADSTYRELVAQQIARLKVLIVSLQSDLLDVELEEDLEVAAQTSASLNEAICSHTMCIEMIQELDAKLNVAVILVPSDGNCMAWSLRCLHLEAYVNQNYKQKSVLKSCGHVRSTMKAMWNAKAADDQWQKIFGHCYQDHLLDIEQAPRPAKPAGQPDNKSQAKDKIKRAAHAAPLPVARREPVDPTLMGPSGFLEPPAPDVEGMVSDLLLKGHEKKPARKRKGVDLEEIGELEEEDQDLTIRRRAHKRMVKKKPIDVKKLKMDRVMHFLAKKKLCNGDFIKMHRRAVVLRKAGVCSGGSFVDFRELLVSGKQPDCEICRQWMQDNAVTVDQIQEMLLQAEEAPPVLEEDAAHVDGPDEGILPQQNKRRESKADVRKACLEYIKSVPYIEPVDGQVLKYHCAICTTTKNKEGKFNTFGPNPTLTTVKRFIGEHITSQGHLRALGALESREDLQVADADADPEDEPCEGYCVSNPASTGTLHFYLREFGLWATHSKLDSKAAHTYQQNATTGDWFVRHKQCCETRPADRLCCKMCERLGEPKTVQRLVVQFTRNFVAAHLLSRKLYFPPDELEAYIKEIDDTAFGRFNTTMWEGLRELSLVHLQAFVVNTYQRFPDHLKTLHLSHFLQTVVYPCMRINVTRIDEGLAPVAAQFELDEIKIKIADAAVRGQLDASPFLQGILLQMMRKLDKDRRGVGMQGRPMASTATEHQLMSDAAFEFAMAGKNKELAIRLGQQLRPAALSTEDLPNHSLPNPTLALAAQRAEILRDNLQAIHRLFSLAEGQEERRLIVSIDHTYLCRQLCQSKLAGQAGLIGAAWSPDAGEDQCWMPFSSMKRDSSRTPAAPLMLECLCWNPNESSKNRTFSICSMPMALKAAVVETGVKDRNRGKWVS
eukprot:s131_g42.t1